MSEGDSKRRQARSTQTRRKIIDAALVEFSDHGFDGATTRSIAKRANIRHALLTYHFETKLNVWQTAMSDILSRFRDAFRSRIDGLRGVDEVSKLRLLQEDFIRLSAQRPELHRLMSHEAGKASDRVLWLVDTLHDDFDMFIGLIKAAQAAGRYVEGDPLHLHYMFLGSAVRVFMVSAEVETLMQRSPFDSAFVEDHIALSHRLFFR